MGGANAVHPADPILQAYGLGKLDDASSVSVSQHLEACDPCRQRAAELSSDDFPAQLPNADVKKAASASAWSPSSASLFGQTGGQYVPPPANTLPPEQVAHAAYFIHQAALGLQHAHERGMVHRDIKPANLIQSRDGKKLIVKVLDFGLAKVKSEGAIDTGLTYEGQMLGTPDYNAPEQSVDASSADIRADIYSLGCTLYCLLAGGPPFQVPTLHELRQAHHSMDALPLNLARPDVPVELAAVVAKMMAKEPERRFQEPKEVSQALMPFFKQASPPAAKVDPRDSTASQSGVRPLTSANGVMKTAPVIQSASAAAGQENPMPEPRWETLIELNEDQPLKAPELSSPGRPKLPKRARIGLAAGTGVLLLGLIGLWAASMIRAKTPNGTLVIENVPVDAVVEVNGKKVTVVPVDGKPIEVELEPGTHGVVIKHDGTVIKGESVTIESGKPSRLTIIRREPLVPPPPPKPHGTLVIENVPENARVEVDGKTVVAVPVDGKPIEVQLEPGPHGLVVKRGGAVITDESVTIESGKGFRLAIKALFKPKQTNESTRSGSGKKPDRKSKLSQDPARWFQPGTIWKGQLFVTQEGGTGDTRFVTLTVLERDGERFKVRWEGPFATFEVGGTCANGEIGWLARDAVMERGPRPFADSSGTIQGEDISLRSQGVINGKQSFGRVSLRLEK